MRDVFLMLAALVLMVIWMIIAWCNDNRAQRWKELAVERYHEILKLEKELENERSRN